MKDRNEYFREYRKKNAEKLRKYNREYNREWRKANGYRNEEKSHLKFPERQRARELLRNAMRRGEIKRKKCEVCKKPNAQAHHPDYCEPLNVRWFCPLHHSNQHKKHD